jgi:hypothetical protein
MQLTAAQVEPAVSSHLSPCIRRSKVVLSFGIFTPYDPTGAAPGHRRCTVYWMCEPCARLGDGDAVERILNTLPWYAGVIGSSEDS